MVFDKIKFDADTPNKTEFIGGWAGDQIDKFNGWTDEQIQKLIDAIAKGIYKGFIAIVDTLCEFIFWSSKIGIIACIIVYIASKDKKSVSLGIKLLLVYFVATVVRNNI